MDTQPSISVIVPTLNEEKYLEHLLVSIERQKPANFEIIVVDGGSVDKTVEIAKKHGGKALVLPGLGEFSSRNIGAENAKGEYLLFTCSDIIFPEGLFKKILNEFQKDPELIAVTGPGYPYDAALIGKIEYAAYNIIRFLFAKLPKPLKRFSTSTNFLVVRKDFFEKTEGFVENDINADGLMGRTLLNIGKVEFSLKMYFYLSARRMIKMGLLNFNKHYLYILENFFFNLSNTKLLEKIKVHSKWKHRKIHES
jgi:glycosyltransferase involved in cell wall biosynthesis